MDLRLSRRGDYVLRSAISLACAYDTGTPRKRLQVAAEMGIPQTFVSQILGDLTRAGLAVSSCGNHGGYRLARPPAEVSLLELVEAGEGTLTSGDRALGEGMVHPQQVNPISDSLGEAAGALRARLASTSLADLVGSLESSDAAVTGTGASVPA